MVAILQPLKNFKPIPIDRAVILVGRGEDCDVVIHGSKKISRKHCCLVQSDQSFLIRDLGSTNGVWVNGKRVDRESEMADGDRVAIGDVEFQFFLKGLQQSAALAAHAAQPDGADIVITTSDNAPAQADDEKMVDILDDDLLDDDRLLDDGMSYDEDADLVDDAIVVDVPSEAPPPPRSSAKTRPVRQQGESEPVINLDDDFSDEDFEDIVVFDDD